jgi:hypothetical protein
VIYIAFGDLSGIWREVPSLNSASVSLLKRSSDQPEGLVSHPGAYSKVSPKEPDSERGPPGQQGRDTRSLRLGKRSRARGPKRAKVHPFLESDFPYTSRVAARA